MGNGRLEDILTGWNFLLYGDVQRYPLIFESFFLPPDIPARPNFFPDSNAKWSSVAGYLPLFSCAGVIAFLKSKKRHWASRITKICIVFAFIPGLNAMFTMFNYNYYARWFYMPLLLMSLMTVLSLENRKIDLLGGIKWTAVFIAVFSVIGVIPSTIKQDENAVHASLVDSLLVWGGILLIFAAMAVLLYTVLRLRKKDEKVKRNLSLYTLFVIVLSVVGILPIAWYAKEHDNFSDIFHFLPPFPERFWAYIVIGIIGLALGVFALSFRKKREIFFKAAALGVCFITVAYAIVFIAFGKSHSYTYYDVVTQGLRGAN